MKQVLIFALVFAGGILVGSRVGTPWLWQKHIALCHRYILAREKYHTSEAKLGGLLWRIRRVATRAEERQKVSLAAFLNDLVKGFPDPRAAALAGDKAVPHE